MVGRLGGRQLEVRPAQLFRLVNRRQGLEELHTGREVVDRQAGDGFEQDAARDGRRDEHAQRAQFGDREADSEAADPGKGEPSLNTDEEHPVLDRRGGVEVVDGGTGGIELDDAAYQAGVDLPAEQIALDRDTDGRNVGDRELPGQQFADIDLDALDGAREFQPFNALQAGDGRRQGQHKIARVVLDVGPGNADFGDLDR